MAPDAGTSLTPALGCLRQKLHARRLSALLLAGIGWDVQRFGSVTSWNVHSALGENVCLQEFRFVFSSSYSQSELHGK